MSQASLNEARRALGIGRIGTIICPVVGRILLSLSWDNQHLFLLAGISGVIATLAIILLASLVKQMGLLHSRPVDDTP